LSSNSPISNSTSKSYALALYELAKENIELNKVADGMDGLKTLLSESSDFKEMILNPTVTKEEKNKVIIKMVNQYNFCQTLKKFLSFLIKNKIIQIHDLPTTQDGEINIESDITIPPWIKNNAGWWADGQIDDGSFVSGLQWLISNGIMKIS